MPQNRRSPLSLIHGWVPFGLLERKPRHYLEMLRIAWRNRRRLRYAWRVLTRGVCDGCALGTSGLRDWTIDGTHLCLVRLNLLELNTASVFDPAIAGDVSRLRERTSKELRELGRIGFPLRRRRGEPGFARVTFDEVWRDVGPRWRALDPARTAMFVTSRGVTNEVYYVAQKVMRFLGSNSVDNSARLCHAPSSVGLKSAIGVAATTCSYRDWYEADLIVFLGSNPANDQPVAMKYLEQARRRGARVLLVNAFREPGMQRYWVPSSPLSALFGTRMCDRTFLVRVGGDLAFLTAAAKVIVERGWHRPDFIEEATSGFEEYRALLARQPVADLAARAGVTVADVEEFAREIGTSDRGVLVWSMGITHHDDGSDCVKAIANLALLREWVGRPGTGLMPIRGHSGVQGGAEMGAYSTVLPGGVPIDAESSRRFSELWGFEVPARPGRTTVEYLEDAQRGELDALWCIGGNFLETMPDPGRIAAGLARIGLRVHTDLVLTSAMLVDPADTVYVLPSRTRYEQRGGGTETSTERRVIYSPEIPRDGLGEARSEWELLLDLARAVRPEDRAKVQFEDGAAIRAEIERAVPAYHGIAALRERGDQFQWGGPMLCAGRRFPTADGRARFQGVEPRPPAPRAGAGRGDSAGAGAPRFRLATRRGKQFNSMIQREVDALTGAARDHVFMCREDAVRLGLEAGDPIVLASATGRFRGRVFLADVAPGTLQGHWPEVNGLIAHGVVDAPSHVPDYNADVTVERG